MNGSIAPGRPDALDALLALIVFLGLPTHAFLYLIGREVGRVRGEMSRWKADAEADASEGFPPPGPPTTGQPFTPEE